MLLIICIILFKTIESSISLCFMVCFAFITIQMGEYFIDFSTISKSLLRNPVVHIS